MINPYQSPRLVEFAEPYRRSRRVKHFWSLVLYLLLLSPMVLGSVTSISSTVADELFEYGCGLVVAALVSSTILIGGVSAYVLGVAYVIRTTYVRRPPVLRPPSE